MGDNSWNVWGILITMIKRLQARTQVVERVGYILVGMGVACASVPSRGIWGYAPPGKFWISRHSEIVSDAILE